MVNLYLLVDTMFLSITVVWPCQPGKHWSTKSENTPSADFNRGPPALRFLSSLSGYRFGKTSTLEVVPPPQKNRQLPTRWVPTGYKWSYTPYKWL